MILEMMTEMTIFDAESDGNIYGQDEEKKDSDEENGCDNAIEEY